MPIIEVDHVTKEFELGQLVSLRQSLVNAFNRLVGRPVDERKPFKALDDVTFSVERGEVLGIIGHNGAGKSTMLKLLAGIAKPTSGRVSVIGKVAPLIEVGAGMVPDLTGRENIYLNSSILGIPRREIARKFDEIVGFAELEEFIDTPMKRYSSGMKMKLGFALATSIEAEILIVDEVLTVGDLAFQRKCFDRMEDLITGQGRTVLLVSHDIRQVERLCKRVILLDHGRAISDGLPDVVCDKFYALADEKIKSQDSKKHEPALNSEGFELLELAFIGEDGRRTDRVEHGKDAVISFRFALSAPLGKPTVGIGIHTTDLLYLATENSERSIRIPALECGEHEFRLRLAKLPFLPGVYSLRAGLNDGDADRVVYYGESLFHFQVVPKAGSYVKASGREGFLQLDATWDLVPDSRVQTSRAAPAKVQAL